MEQILYNIDERNILPSEPGVYKFFNSHNDIIYVGKAKSLKKRVASYFNKSANHNLKTKKMIGQIEKIAFTIVSSEYEALLLENNLIKNHLPKFNILMRDDKSYPYLCIVEERFPRLLSVRPHQKIKGKFYGPYTDSKAMNEVLELIKNLYTIRTCNYNLLKANIEKKKFKVCLEYHIKNCLGPCEGLELEEDYNNDIEEVKHILKGNFNLLKLLLKEEKELEENEKLKDEVPKHTGKEEAQIFETIDEDESVDENERFSNTEDYVINEEKQNVSHYSREQQGSEYENLEIEEVEEIEEIGVDTTDKPISPKSSSESVSPSLFDFPNNDSNISHNIQENYYKNKMDSDDDSQSPQNESSNKAIPTNSKLFTESNSSTPNVNNSTTLNKTSQEKSRSSSYMLISDPPNRSYSQETKTSSKQNKRLSPTLETNSSPNKETGNTEENLSKILTNTKIDITSRSPFGSASYSSNSRLNFFFTLQLKPEYYIDKWKKSMECSILYKEDERITNQGTLSVKLGSCPLRIKGVNGYYIIAGKKGTKFATLKNNLLFENIYDKIYFRYYCDKILLPDNIKIEIHIERKGFNTLDKLCININPRTMDYEILDIK